MLMLLGAGVFALAWIGLFFVVAILVAFAGDRPSNENRD
jgi:hypothetical protein